MEFDCIFCRILAGDAPAFVVRAQALRFSGCPDVILERILIEER